MQYCKCCASFSQFLAACMRWLHSNLSHPLPLSHCRGLKRKIYVVTFILTSFMDMRTATARGAFSYVIVVLVARACLPKNACAVPGLKSPDRCVWSSRFSVQYVFYCPELPLVILISCKCCVCTHSNVLFILDINPPPPPSFFYASYCECCFSNIIFFSLGFLQMFLNVGCPVCAYFNDSFCRVVLLKPIANACVGNCAAIIPKLLHLYNMTHHELAGLILWQA